MPDKKLYNEPVFVMSTALATILSLGKNTHMIALVVIPGPKFWQ